MLAHTLLHLLQIGFVLTSSDAYQTQASNSLNVQRNVPLFLSNIKLGQTTKVVKEAADLPAVPISTPVPGHQLQPTIVTALTSSTATVAQKVPSRPNNVSTEFVAAATASQQFVQTPASSAVASPNIFFANYNNQHNVMQLVRNMDERLRNIRNVEMRVATIQEIFDSMHLSSSSPLSSGLSSNADDQNSFQNYKQSPTIQRLLEHDLQVFSRRLARKLERALEVVRELREFFQTNITQLMQFSTDYEIINEDESESDFYMDAHDTENQSKYRIKPLYLNTVIQTCCEMDEAGYVAPSENYNKQQIEILNYFQTDNRQSIMHSSVLNEKSELSLEANLYIAKKIQTLKTTLIKNDNNFVLNNQWRMASNGINLKFIGNHFKHIYFLSRSDDASDSSPRYFNDLHFRYLYVSAIERKYVFLLIDVGSAMNADLLELTKSYVSSILQLLSANDLFSLVTVADEVESMVLLDASPQDAASGIYLTTRERKEEILNYINSLIPSKALTNHSLGFEFAFKMLARLQNASLITPSRNPIEFVYITRGLLTNLTDAMYVLNVVAKGQSSLQQPIVINTCAVVLDEKRIMYEKQFLRDIATQNYTKYDIDVKDWVKTPEIEASLGGKLFVLTKTQPENLIRACSAIFGRHFDERYLTNSWQVHSPVVDISDKDTIVSITHPVAPFGVVGVNLYLSDLVEDIINYQQQQQQQQQLLNTNKNEYTYAFLIEPNGNTLAHPAFPRPYTQKQTPFPVDIGYLENATDFINIRQRMLHEESGSANSSIYLWRGRTQELMTRNYIWHNILHIYILCLVVTSKPMKVVNATAGTEPMFRPILQMPSTLPLALQHYVAKNNMPTYQQEQQHSPQHHAHPHDYEEYLTSMDLVYHRLDLLPIQGSTNVCRYFRQIATFDTATLFLSSAAFESPFTFFHNNRMGSVGTQKRTVESIMAYIKDVTGLLANPGLRPQIRHEVNVLYNAMQHLKKRHQDARGTLRNYIIRRYIASVNGVLQVYPGCLLSANYDPTRRPWFRKAMKQPGKIVSTEPYLDAGGAGYIITIAHTIFEGKANVLHSIEHDEPVAIVALDVPYAFYYRMILDSTPLCQLNNIKCLLFENEGYLVAHPSMLEPSSPQRNSRRPHEHLTHKESYFANDILNHKNLVRKMACANYQNRTLQRYYIFNTSLSDILSNVVQGERTKYAIALVRGSNIFAAVLNSTCDGGAFCPCSTIDRICLNCKRMDQTDCECPCECPMQMSSVNGDDQTIEMEEESYFANITKQYSYCEPPTEHFTAMPQMSPHQYAMLPVCANINCDIYGTQHDCLAVMGCEWCQQDVDGNGFAAAFCSAQSSCFNGVLAAATPYGDLDDIDLMAAHGYNPGQKPNSYSAFGPVGGAIIVLGIVIGFAIYCYRHNADLHAQEQFYMDSIQEENYGLPLSRFNFDDCQAHDDPPGGGGAGGPYDHAAAQRSLMHAADISPYHMSTGSSYRRPPNNESDHGYSTMTPHEDSSDHQCFTLAEPLLLSDKRHSKSDTMSISTSISSPTNRQHYNNPFPANTNPKDVRHNLTSPKKYYSPARVYEQTTLPLDDAHAETLLGATHYILAPVTVHRHMETSES